MKIIQVIPFLGLAGAEIMCENLTNALRAQGHEVIVVSMYDHRSEITRRLEKSGTDIRYLGKREGLDLSMISKMKKLFQEEKPDVIHTHLYVTAYAVPAAVLAGVKRKVHTIHSVAQKEAGDMGKKLNRWFFHKNGVTPVALSNTVQATVEEVYGLPKTRIPVVLNGIDLSRCSPKEDYSRNGDFKIIHVGRFQEVKNHKGLVDAFGLLHSKYPDTQLHLVGDGELQGAIENHVQAKSLSHCVKFWGSQENVYGFLETADVFCLPSVYEGIPMSLIEAMGTGLPVVATEVGGIPDMLDSSCARLTPVDPEVIFRGLEDYYLDENLRSAHGAAVLERSKRFSSRTMAAEYVKVYETVK